MIDAKDLVLRLFNSGLSHVAFTLPEGGEIAFADGVSVEDRAAVLAIASGEVVPTPPMKWTPLQFIERFTDDEQLAIVTAAQSNPALRLWYDKLMAATEVVANDPRTVAGMDALVAAGLLTQERRNAILS